MKDISGKKFGRLTPTEPVYVNGVLKWKCICDCGNEKLARPGNLEYGGTQSCGCLHKERVNQSNATPGFSKGAKAHPLYGIWRAMKTRCENKNVHSYKDYGGRGIKVCKRWSKGESDLTGFQCFLKDMGEKPTSKHTLERMDTEKGYSPENCKWETPHYQNRNKRSNVNVNIEGNEMCLEDACLHYGIKRSTVNSRLQYGWDVMKALTTPVRKGGGKARN